MTYYRPDMNVFDNEQKEIGVIQNIETRSNKLYFSRALFLRFPKFDEELTIVVSIKRGELVYIDDDGGYHMFVPFMDEKFNYLGLKTRIMKVKFDPIYLKVEENHINVLGERVVFDGSFIMNILEDSGTREVKEKGL
jgi:hypothetical protein